MFVEFQFPDIYSFYVKCKYFYFNAAHHHNNNNKKLKENYI